MTPMCREMVSQVMVSQVLPAERWGNQVRQAGAKKPPHCQEALRSPQATGPQVSRDARECCLCWWGNRPSQGKSGGSESH